MNAIETIKANLTMKEVLNYYGIHVLRGNRALCPFHDDKHPSMYVYPTRFACYACNIQGDVFSFVMEYFKLSFPDALNKICKDFGIPNEKEYYSPDDPVFIQSLVDKRAMFFGARDWRVYQRWIENEYIDEHRLLFLLGKNEPRRRIIEDFLNEGGTRTLYNIDKERRFDVTMPRGYVYHGDAIWNTEKGIYQSSLPKEVKIPVIHKHFWEVSPPPKNYMDELSACTVNVSEEDFFFDEGESFEHYSARCNMPMPF